MNKENSTLSDEIDLFDLGKHLFGKKLFFFKISIISSIIGLIIGIITPEEYQAKSIFIVQDSSIQNGMNGLSGLAAMAGVNIGSPNGVQSLPPVLYPDIVASVSFQKDLMNSLITYKQDSISLYEYYMKHQKETILQRVFKYTIGLPFTIINNYKDQTIENPNNSPGFISLTEKEKRIANKINSHILLSMDEETKSITISSNFPTALMSAEICKNYISLLQRYVTKLRIKKASQQYLFIKERYLEQRTLVEQNRKRIAVFKDRNKNISTSEAQITLKKLSNDFNVVFSVYTELAKQLEQAKLQVKLDTPIFTIIDPISIPSSRNKPKRLLYILISVATGLLLTTIFYSIQYSSKK